MSKSVKVLLSIVMVAILMVVGMATVALAQEEESVPELAVMSGLLARAAKILDISEDELATAFKQAWQEMRGDRLIQATDNESRGEDWYEGIGERQIKLQQRWRERKVEAMNKGQMRGRISSAVRGRQMISVPRGWQGSLPYPPAD